MASVIECFLCHFCFEKYRDQSSLISHFSNCHSNNSMKRKHDDSQRLPRLTKTDRELLQILKLHHSNDKSSSQKVCRSSTNLELPLTYNSIYVSKQKSFDDFDCQTNKSLLKSTNSIEHEHLPIPIHLKSSSYHTYKYSRREQTNFYTSIKRARLKKQNIQIKKSRQYSLIFDKKSYSIRLPTQITSRQRLNNNFNNSFPLIFDTNFHSLVQFNLNPIFKTYSSIYQTYFHLIHSIASQEFQLIIYSNDHEHHLAYTAYSFLQLLRQTMNDYSVNLQRTMKRNYFQTFNQLIMNPSKLPRYEQTPEIHIDDQSTTTTSRIEHSLSIETEPIIASFVPVIEVEQPTPKIEPIEIDEPIIYPIERARIRVRNGSNQTRKSIQKKITNKNDEYSLNKPPPPIRMSTRLNTIKVESLPELIVSYETKPVIISSSQFVKQWQTHTVFYRCHACLHEEFFVVLSRECMNLHISSHHANMEENFKQRLSNFLNNKGRSLKIFQHFLKWQQPWTEKQIEQIFKLSNK